MSSTIMYDNVNEIALLTANFTDSAGAAADPTAVICIVTDPAGGIVTHTYGGASPADITKPLVGEYELNVPCYPSITDINGLWNYVWIGSGAVSDIQPGTWRVLPPELNKFYCGMEELKDRLAIADDNDDYAIQQAIQATSGFINEWCGQHFYRITETRTFVPHDILQLSIDPLVTITALNVDQTGNGTYSEAWVQDVDYQLKLGDDRYNLNALGIKRPYKKVQAVQSGKWFPYIYPWSHWDRVQIIGTWGWPAVPPPVAQANLELAAEFFKRKDAPFGVVGVADFGVARVQSNPWVIELLRPFTDVKKTVGI